MIIQPINGDFSICKVADYTKVGLDTSFCFSATTDEEKSLVCPTKMVPANTTHREDGWRAFRIRGMLDFSLIGILADISRLLAGQKIGIFVVSTFNTDYVLTKKESFRRALDALKDAGYTIE